MEKWSRYFVWAAGLSAGMGLLAAGCTSSSVTGAGQPSAMVKAKDATNLPDLPRWGVQVQSVNNVPDTQSEAFQETFVIENNDIAPRDVSEILVRVYFDEPQSNPNQISPVNSTFAAVLNPNGTVTGTNSTVSIGQFSLFTGCENPQGQLVTQAWDFSFQPGTIVPASGFVSFTPELWRGGAFPFNNSGNFTSQNGNTTLHDDPNVNLFFNSIGLTTLACDFLTPLIQEPENNPCTGAPFATCATQVP